MRGQLQLLLVEDDAVDRMAVCRALRQAELSAAIEQVETVGAALEILEQRRFDCLILDYQLPDGNAKDLLQKTADWSPPRPPVLILTGYGSESVAVELMRTGASDYLPKDELTPSRIAQSVRNAMRVRRSEDALRRAYDELEQRVVERTAELAAANRELEQQIADRRRAEERARQHLEQLAHVSRLSTLGEMSAGIAHELNQPLGAIVNYANGCMRRIESDTADLRTLREILARISTQAERAGQIIHRLRSLVTGRETEEIATDLNRLLLEIVELERVEARLNGVEIELELAEDLPLVTVDPIQIQQVILNLLRNGIEAMDSTPVGERCLRVRTFPSPDLEIGVRVADQGPGCDPEHLKQIFDPFFTTKDSGMGLGLAISRSIIQAHSGQLWAEAVPGGGLAFTFTLPAGAEEPNE